MSFGLFGTTVQRYVALVTLIAFSFQSVAVPAMTPSMGSPQAPEPSQPAAPGGLSASQRAQLESAEKAPQSNFGVEPDTSLGEMAAAEQVQSTDVQPQKDSESAAASANSVAPEQATTLQVADNRPYVVRGKKRNHKSNTQQTAPLQVQRNSSGERRPIDRALEYAAAGDVVGEASELIGIFSDAGDAHSIPEADEAFQLLLRRVAAGSLTDAEVSGIDRAFPSWTNLNTPYAKEARMLFVAKRWEHSLRTEDREATKEFVQEAYESAERLIAEAPDSPVQITAVSTLVATSSNIERNQYVEDVVDLVRAQQTEIAEALKLAIRYTVSVDAQYGFSDSVQPYIMSLDLISSAGKDHFSSILEDSNVPNRLKGEYLYAFAMANFNVGQDMEALDAFQAVLDEIPASEPIAQQAAYCVAFVTDRLNTEEPSVGLKAFQEFLDTYPDAWCADRALLTMGHLYYRAEDYVQALNTFEMLEKLYPNSRYLSPNKQLIDYIQKYLLSSQTEAAVTLSTTLPPAVFPPACGPVALTGLMASIGIQTTSNLLMVGKDLAASDTSMEELRIAASTVGIQLRAIDVSTFSSIKPPFITHINGNHFVLVDRVTSDEVSLLDGQRAEEISHQEFLRRATGGILALTANVPEGIPDIPQETLQLARGGEVWPDDNRPDCANGKCQPPDECDGPPPGGGIPKAPQDGDPPPCNEQGGDGDGAGTTGGAGIRLGGGRAADPTTPGESSDAAGLIGSGITAKEVGFYIFPRQGAESVNQTDFSVPLRGDLELKFSRHYHNRWGTPRSEILWYNGAYFHNNFGTGWFHNYQEHLVSTTSIVTLTSSPLLTTPEALLIVDVDGIRRFNIGSYSSGIVTYVPGSDALTTEKAEVIKRDTATNEYWLEQPSGARYNYDGPTTSNWHIGRLLSIEDGSGNVLQLTYDVTENRLSKVSAPSGDGRYLSFEYSGTTKLITKVKLMKTGSGTPIRVVEYEYDNPSYYYPALKKITYPDATYNEYWYGNNTLNSVPAYISKFRDKSGNETVIDYTYSYGAGYNADWWSAWQIVVNHPNGLRTSFVRALAPPEDAIIANIDGPAGSGTPLQTMRYRPMSDGYLKEYDEYWADSSGSVRLRWSNDYGSGSGKYDLLSVDDPGGKRVQTSTYNTKGRLTSIRRGASGTQLLFAYDASGTLVTKRTEPSGSESIYQYDGNKRITRYYHPSMGAGDVDYFYDSYGQLTKVNDPLSREWLYEYDARGNLTEVTDPASGVISYEYDDQGRMTKSIDPLLKNTYYDYGDTGCGCGGGLGRIVKVRAHTDTAPGAFRFALEYDDSGNVTKMTDAEGREVLYTYDIMHRLTAITDGSSSAVLGTYQYDKIGRIVQAMGANGAFSKYSYNYLGHMTKVSDGEGTQVELSYYNNGNLQQLLDGRGFATNFYYWDLGGLAKAVDADGKEVHYWYDAMGHLTKTGAGSGGTTDTVTYTYSTGSASSTDHLTGVAYVNGANTKSAAYYYDQASRLTKITDWMDPGVSAGLRFTYDDVDRLTTYTDFDNATFTYAYDAAGNLTGATDYGGSSYSYTYTDLHQLDTLTAPGSKTWNYDYNNLGQVTKTAQPNGVDTLYAYDSQHRLSKLEHKEVSTSALLDGWSYALDLGGNIREIQDLVTQDTWRYRYDTRNRLLSARRDKDAPYEAYLYRYDPAVDLFAKHRAIYTNRVYDAFTDGETSSNPSWTKIGNWPGSAGATTNDISTTLHPQMKQDVANGDGEFHFSYKITDTTVSDSRLRLVFRDDAATTNMLRLVMYGDRLEIIQVKNGVTTTLLQNYAVKTESGAWYDTTVRAKGNRIEIWRGEAGKNQAMVAQTRLCTVQAGVRFYFDTTPNAQVSLDNVEFLAHQMPTGRIDDRFEDLETYSGLAWTPTGTWTAANGYAHTAATASLRDLTHMVNNGDGEYHFRYNIATDRVRFSFRRNPAANDVVRVAFLTDQANINQVDNGVSTVLTSNTTLTSDTGTWYDVFVKAKGGNIEVWRKAENSAATMVLSTGACTVLSGDRLGFDAVANASVSFDNFAYITEQSTGASFSDNFTDGNYTVDPVWNVGFGTWTGVSGYMRNTAHASGYPALSRPTAFTEADVKFSYYKENNYDATFEWRSPTTYKRMVLSLESTQMRLRDDSSGTFVDRAVNTAADSVSGTWYDVQLRMDGPDVEVWWGAKGSELQKTLSTSSNGVTASTVVLFTAAPNAVVRFDDIDIDVPDPSSSYLAYYANTELSYQIDDGVPTHYNQDAWGRTIGKYQGKFGASYSWTMGDRMDTSISSFPGEGVIAINQYDGLGLRRSKLDVSGYTWWRWNGMEEYAEYAAGTNPSTTWDVGAVRRTYLPGLGEALPSGGTAMATYRYHHNDHLGSPRAVLGQTKTRLAAYDYSPYGESRRSSGLKLDVGFTGHHWDPSVGQYFAPYRYYNPAAARWTAKDPLGYVDGPNMYGYVAGNPVGFVDPMGGSLAFAPSLGGLGGLGAGAAALCAVATAPVSVPTIVVGVIGAAVVGGTIGWLWSKDDKVPSRQTGGSGKPRRHFDKPTDKRTARDKAQEQGGGRKPVHHAPHGPGQKPHYHPAGPKGGKLPDGSHYPYNPAVCPSADDR